MGLRRFLCSCLIFVLFRTQAWRQFQDANICAVDWRKFAGQDYKTAMLKLYRVGNTMAQMVKWLESYRGFGRANMILVGYSLGAHAAGYAGSLLNGQIGEIIGLDPAGPLFTFPYDIGRKYRLDEGDARFVQVMHTSSGTLGTVQKCGHADFYPNGGASPQSNCVYPSNTNENNKSSIAVSWEDWWTYDGISGPAFWGLINPEWSLCNKGRRQSPVNLEPQRLLFDPNLRPLHIDKHRISGTIMNTGHSVIFTADNETAMIYDGLQTPVNITGGPLSYRYRFHEIHIHYGLHDQFGSEHSVEGYTFPAEIQIFGYNSQLYSNFSDSLNRAQGIVGVAILLQLGDLSNAELRMLTDQLDRIKFGGDESPVRRLSVRGLLPDTDHYMTYEGSTTSPACHETVTWIVLNKPIYITKQQLFALRRLMQGGPDHPKAPVGNNFRPPQPLLHRPIRTNIDFRTKQNGKACPSMYRDVHYKANSWKQH